MAAPGKDDSEWLNNVRERLEKDETRVSQTNSDMFILSIAHPFLRLLKPEAYIPQVISIGPYHHCSSKQYEETDTYKLKIASALEREINGFKFSKLVEKIESFEERIRAYYHKHIPYSKERLSWMLALDTSFVLQFLKSTYTCNRGSRESESRLLRNTPLWYAIKNDILMLENQVPKFLLIEALEALSVRQIRLNTQVGNRSQGEGRQRNRLFPQFSSSGQVDNSQDDVRFQEELHLASMLQVACSHFSPFGCRGNDDAQLPDPKSTRHVLDYLYHYVTAASPERKQSESQASINVLSPFLKNPLKCLIYDRASGNLLSKEKKTKTKEKTCGNLPSATELSKAGIKFARNPSRDLREISFKRKTSTFLLPKITINECTEVILRNLVALELNLETKQKPLTRYIYLMDRLVDTEKDVAMLKKYDILNSQMGSDAEVAQMWNSMSMLIGVNTFDPVDRAIEEANKNYRSKHWRVLLAEFQKTYCSKPWLVVSVLSAGILLLLTAVQVFCLFYSCNKYSASN